MRAALAEKTDVPFIDGLTTLNQEVNVDHLPVTGTLPTWLSGTLVRNGPGKFEVGHQNLRHWFDGLAMLHRYTFHAGQVSYANRYLRTQAYEKSTATGKLSFREFGTDPCRSVFGKLFTIFDHTVTDNTNVNVTALNGRFIALTEAPPMIEFDPETLQTLAALKYDDAFKDSMTSAHPHYDAKHGEAFSYGLHFGQSNSYNLYRIPNGTLRRELIASITTKNPGYMHSFAVTEHYLILTEFPVYFDSLAVAFGTKSISDSLMWKPQNAARMIVVERATGEVKTILETEPYFAFHHINAFEQGDTIFLDICAYPDSTLISDLYLDNLRADKGIPLSQLRRYEIPLKGKQCSYSVLSTESIDLPRINYARSNGADYRYAYGISTRKDTPHGFQNQLVKVDVKAQMTRTWYQDGSYPGEPVFVAAPNATAEDDGVVLSIALDADKGTSFMLVLDGTSFTELGRAEMPHALPFGFHGQFFNVQH